VDGELPAACARGPGEPQKAYAAFLDYCRLGVGRSLAKLLDRYQNASKPGPDSGPLPPTTRLATLKDWSSRFNWQLRVQAWDAAQQAAEQAEWAARRKQIREADWQAGEALRHLAAQMLEQTPQFLKTTRRLVKGQQGAPDREVITLVLDQGTLFKAVELASKLQRQAAELVEVQRLEHTGQGGGPITTSGVTIYLPDNGREAVDGGEEDSGDGT
jgi:hypothetical protein